MIQSGTRPTKRDGRDYSFHKTFGSVTQFPDNYSVDANLTMPDQNADGYPNGCTGYTQADNATDEDKILYKPAFTYIKTLLIENAPMGSGCDIRDSLKSTKVFGLQAQNETTDKEAEQHIRGQYFNVEKTTDYFDGIRSAIWLNTKDHGVSLGTPWYPEFEFTKTDGVMPTPNWSRDSNQLSWHNYSIKGWKTINGVTYLIVKSWQGKNFGDQGFSYLSREVVNKLLSIQGSAAFTISKAKPEDIQSIKLDIAYVIYTFFRQILLNILRSI